MHLSKSDFKVARTCGTKLYYRKLKYPTTQDDNPYLEFLADGGYMVETISKLLFPEGREIGFGPGQDATALTEQALQDENVTLFEATLGQGLLLARVDILEKKGRRFRLIEAKAKSFDSVKDGARPFRGARGGIVAKWRPYLEDVAFQTLILQCNYPDAEVVPFLCLVDKAKTCNTETTFENFQLTPRPVAGSGAAFRRPEVTFTGDVEALRQNPLVQIVNVSDEVEELLPEVREAAAEFAATISSSTPQRIPPAPSVRCKGCEYRVAGGERSGFRECWGDHAAADPHLLDLYRVDLLGTKGSVAAGMIAAGRCGLLDVSIGDLRGVTGDRQKIQLEWTRKAGEFIDPRLPALLTKCAYPLHFVDFETSAIAVPYHAGMQPYEKVAFQWSCHTITQPGAELTHTEWINIDQAYPNFEFARSLKELLGRAGTVFVWSPFEKTTLRQIRRQLVQYGEADRDLADWLDYISADAGPLVDLCELAKQYYFHPRMKGSLSIKQVLPAVWFESAALRDHRWFLDYRCELDGRLLEPYETLPALPFGVGELSDELEAVHEGTGAIRTYQEMMYGVRHSDPTFRQTCRQLLLNYCKLDTAAMVMIWMHWMTRG